MGNRIGAAIAVPMVVVFLGYYALIARSVPPWIITVAVLVMVLADGYRSVVAGTVENERKHLA